MTEKKSEITIERLVGVLKSIPEQKFLIMDLAPQLVDEKGNIDIIKAIDKQVELNLAIVEVQTYVRDTKTAYKALRFMGERQGE